jgi:Flp pilus assembly protein TadD
LTAKASISAVILALSSALTFALVLSSIYCSPLAAQAPAGSKLSSKAAVNLALKEYKAGHYSQAANLLLEDLREHPDDGKTHYYLGLALKKQGYDMSALKELEMAARLVPPEMVSSFAAEKLEGLDPPKVPPAPKKPQDWFTQMSTSVSDFFGFTKPTVGTSASSGTNSGAEPKFEMPDFMANMKNVVRQTKKMAKSAVGQASPSADSPRRTSGPAEVMHMDEMLDLVEKSKTINVPTWASHSDGLTVFHQAPEGIPEWDFWIARFKRSIQHVLLKRLNAEATEQVRGAAAAIFSVDRKGNLRGSIYATTADSVLNKCLVEAIKDLNHSRILAFPANSNITGWNFQMTWNFGKMLAYIHNYRQQQHQAEVARLMNDVLMRDAQLKAKILKAKREAELKAKLAKLALDKKKTAAKLLEQKRAQAALTEIKAEAEVEGRVLVAPSPKELRAVTLELNDLSANKVIPGTDPFAGIDDNQILSWPDLNR